jgi:hypothetical protein
LSRFFRIFLDDQSKAHWTKFLDLAAYAYNTSHHTGLGTSPYEALFGRLPPLGPLSVPLDPRDPVNETNFYRYIGMRRRELFQKRKLIQEALLRAQNQQLNRINRHKHKIPFQVGDFVFYKNHNARTKWDPKFTGPWRIIDKISPVVFELDLEGKRFSAHAAHLKPYKAPQVDSLKRDSPQHVQQVESEEEVDHNTYEQIFMVPGPYTGRERDTRRSYGPYSFDRRLGRDLRNMFRLPGSPQSPVQNEDDTTPRRNQPNSTLARILRAPGRLAERLSLSERPRHSDLYDAGASPSSEYLRRGERSRLPPDRYSSKDWRKKSRK